MPICPCGSGRQYDSCCKPIIQGTRKAETAEELMRARYSAYVMGEVKFIVNSTDPEAREGVSEEATLEWSQTAKWKGFEILAKSNGQRDNSMGVVEFIAHFEMDGKNINHHEKAMFRKINDEWYFFDGQIITETYRRPTPKIGRNAPCPCGSGKKYKFCCGRNQ